MLAVVSLVVVLVVSLIVVRVATVALTLTGLSRDLARFQARSAFTGSGFTTHESEDVVGHPVRRRIIMILMLMGNAGIVTAVSSLILSFANVEKAPGLRGEIWFRVLLLSIGMAGLLVVAQSRYVDRWMSRFITWALREWTEIDARDYAALLHLTGDYTVTELRVEPEDWIAGRELREVRLDREGVLVLGIQRAHGPYLGAPKGTTPIRADDTLLLYGRESTLADLDDRRAGPEGSRAHVAKVAEQAAREETERNVDEESRPEEGSTEKRAAAP